MSLFLIAAVQAEPKPLFDKSVADIQALGHRVVHGGERFKESVLITDEVVRQSRIA
jgi:acetate kinase